MPEIAQVQLCAQLAVTSSSRPPRRNFFFFFVFPRERSIARKEKEGEVKETYANC